MNEKYEIIKDIILHTIPGTDENYSPIDGVRLVRKNTHYSIPKMPVQPRLHLCSAGDKTYAVW